MVQAYITGLTLTRGKPSAITGNIGPRSIWPGLAPKRLILRTYAERCGRLGSSIAALIPQVYLHCDPYTAAQRGGPGPLSRQRMDFLLLLPHRARVVIECDGKQHYADHDGRAHPHRYAAMMAEDRDLRLKGYEVYRFGGAELADDQAAQHLLSAFFGRMHQRYHQ